VSTTPRFVNTLAHGNGMVCPVLDGSTPRSRSPRAGRT